MAALTASDRITACAIGMVNVPFTSLMLIVR
jgi:hypothetical protein